MAGFGVFTEARNAGTMMAGLRQKVRALDPSLPIFCVRTMPEFLNRTVSIDMPANDQWVFNAPFFIVLSLAVGGPREPELACLLWISPAWKTQARDAWIDWSDQQRRQNLQSLVNDGRFLILPWVHVKGLASKILALSARQMPHDWGNPLVSSSAFRNPLWVRLVFAEPAIGLPTGSMSGKPLDAVEWTESTKLKVGPSQTSMLIRWYATCVNGYA